MGSTDFTVPTFCRIEYLNESGEWWVGNAGYNLMNPAAYVEKLVANGHHARIIERLTAEDGKSMYDGEVFVLPETLGEQNNRRGNVAVDTLHDMAVSAGLSFEMPTVEEDEDMLEDLDDLFAEYEDEAETPPGVDVSHRPTGEEGVISDDDLLAEYEEVLEMAPESDQPYPGPGENLLIADPNSYDYVFNGHAGAGPSAAERWMNCTASLRASREFLETLNPEQQAAFAVSSSAARQGTTAHAAAETEARLILGEVTQEEADHTMMELSIEPPDGEFYDDEMADYIEEYVDLIRVLSNERGTDHVLIEQRVSAAVPLTGMHEGDVYEVAGSGDCIGLPTEEAPELVVVDLKYGEGIDVSVDQNPQIRIYALGALGLLVDDEGDLITPVDNIRYYIVQPRLGGIKEWSESLDDLLAWRDEVLAPSLTAALYDYDPAAVFAPSNETCQWCPARGGCSALAEQRVAQAADLFDTITEAEYNDGPGSFPETRTLSDARLGQLLEQISGLVNIHDSLKAEASRRLLRGDNVPGFKLVSYTPPRKWKPEAVTELDPDVWAPDEREKIEALWSKKLITPAQAEKALGDGYDQFKDFIESPDKRPVVAAEGDRRKTWAGRDPETMFDVENED